MTDRAKSSAADADHAEDVEGRRDMAVVAPVVVKGGVEEDNRMAGAVVVEVAGIEPLAVVLLVERIVLPGANDEAQVGRYTSRMSCS